MQSFLFCVYLGLMMVWGASDALAKTIHARTCSQADVQAAVDSAVDGDTIMVPSGTAHWATPVAIGKIIAWNPVVYRSRGIILRGAGAEHTVVLGQDILLSIYIEEGKPVRVTGFTFQSAQACIGISGPYAGTTVWRVDHCQFRSSHRGFEFAGGNGLVDNCVFTDCYQGVSPMGLGDTSWNSPISLGTANAVYIEDCRFDYSEDLDGALDAYNGARYVFRYNTVNNTCVGHHGRDSGGFRSAHSWEIYGNTFMVAAGTGYTTFRSRGGTGVVFNNTVTGPYAGLLLSYYCACKTEGWICGWPECTAYPCIDQNGRTTDQDSDGVQDLQPVYAWNNPWNGTNLPLVAGDCADAVLFQQENRDYYNEHASFDGSIGIGRGLLANRPATCVPGVAYWATDQGNWNQSGSGEQGVLYRCVAPNTWEAAYMPYTYPHPLRSAEGAE